MVALLAACMLGAIGPVQAQAPEISGILPCGGRRGTVVKIQTDGKNLQGAKLILEERGVSVKAMDIKPAGDGVALQLSVTAEAAIGPHELRMATSKGVSNAVRFWVDAFPEILETEPNDDPLHAQSIESAPVVVNGRIGTPTDRDCFAFQAHANETWVFDVNAARIRSRLDPVIELRTSDGQMIRMAQSVWENDPRLVYRFVRSGKYFVTVRDTEFQGGPDYPYRLTLGPIPAISGYLPRGGEAGHPVVLDLQGINFETPSATAAIPSDARPGEEWVSLLTNRGPALAIPLLIDHVPVLKVTETPSHALPAWPIALDGTFQHASETRFTFRAGPADPLVFDLLGRRIGSLIDGSIRVMDASGKEIAANDDAIGKDARLEFTPPRDALYTLEVRNVEGKTGPDCFYRLLVHRVEPGFQLTLTTDRTQVGTGGTSVLTVTTERTVGLEGPIVLHAENLPPGVTCSGGILAPGQTAIEITFTAGDSTPIIASALHLVGEATISGHVVRGEAAGREQYMPRWIDPGMFQDDSYKRPWRSFRILPLGVIDRAEPFSLRAEPSATTLTPGQKIDILVHANRRAGANGEIKLELRGLPEKVTASAPAIPANKNDVHITLTAASDLPATVRNLIVQGTLDKAVQPAPAIVLTTHR